MKRPLEFLTAGLVLGELTVYAGSSNPVAGLCLTACFVCLIFLSFRAMRAAAGRSVPHAFSVLPSDSSVKRKLFPILWNAENCIFRYLKCHFSLPAQRGAIRLGALLLAVGFFLGALRLGISCIPSRESRLLDQKLDGDSGRVTLDLAIESLDINPKRRGGAHAAETFSSRFRMRRPMQRFVPETGSGSPESSRALPARGTPGSSTTPPTSARRESRISSTRTVSVC